MVKQISIITLVTRPNNLILIKESIESISWNGWDTEWVLILDDEFLGFNEFDKDDYISKVLSFANDLDKLEKTRKFIFDEVLKTNTFNTKKFALNFWKSILDTYSNHK